LSTAYAAAPGTAGDPTLNHRFFLWHVAWQLILDRPIVGVGLNRFAEHAAGATEILVATKEGAASVWERYGTWHAHNEYLNYWAEGGLLTLVGFLGMVISALIRSTRHGLGSAVASGAGASVLVHSLVSYPLHMPVTAILFWVLLGITNGKESSSLREDTITK
jgi:O-antigen ligase